jgi:two-component system response regulator MprA
MPTPTAPKNAFHVMVVDDDARAARMLALMLREDGYDVEVVLDGAAAINRLAREPLPDLLITDFRMPHADGYAVISYARSREPTLPVLMVTGYPEVVQQWGAALDPPAVVFAKPLAYGELVRAVEQLARPGNAAGA